MGLDGPRWPSTGACTSRGGSLRGFPWKLVILHMLCECLRVSVSVGVGVGVSVPVAVGVHESFCVCVGVCVCLCACVSFSLFLCHSHSVIQARRNRKSKIVLICSTFSTDRSHERITWFKCMCFRLDGARPGMQERLSDRLLVKLKCGTLNPKPRVKD